MTSRQREHIRQAIADFRRMTARQRIAYAIGMVGYVLMLPGGAVFWISCWIGRQP